jgi:hypothetical protein
MAILYGTMQNGQLVPVEADAQGRLVAQLAADPAKYQQGIWIPKMGATGGDSTHTFSTNIGTWSRTGNRVTVDFETAISALGANGTGIAGVTGLPYVIDSTGSYTGCINYAVNFDANFNPISIRYGAGSTYTEGFAFYKYDLAVGHSNIGTGRFDVGAVASGFFTYLTTDTTWTPINGATPS